MISSSVDQTGGIVIDSQRKTGRTMQHKKMTGITQVCLLLLRMFGLVWQTELLNQRMEMKARRRVEMHVYTHDAPGHSWFS